MAQFRRLFASCRGFESPSRYSPKFPESLVFTRFSGFFFYPIYTLKICPICPEYKKICPKFAQGFAQDERGIYPPSAPKKTILGQIVSALGKIWARKDRKANSRAVCGIPSYFAFLIRTTLSSNAIPEISSDILFCFSSRSSAWRYTPFIT